MVSSSSKEARALDRLRLEWYGKLKEAGFEDIEHPTAGYEAGPMLAARPDRFASYSREEREMVRHDAPFRQQYYMSAERRARRGLASGEPSWVKLARVLKALGWGNGRAGRLLGRREMTVSRILREADDRD